MKQDFSELVEYLDKKFIRLERDVAGLRKEIGGVKNEIGDIKERMATKVEVNKLFDAVDAYMKQGEDYRQEMFMLAHKIDRHEKWFHQIAEKVGVKLEY